MPRTGSIARARALPLPHTSPVPPSAPRRHNASTHFLSRFAITDRGTSRSAPRVLRPPRPVRAPAMRLLRAARPPGRAAAALAVALAVAVADPAAAARAGGGPPALLPSFLSSSASPRRGGGGGALLRSALLLRLLVAAPVPAARGDGTDGAGDGCPDDETAVSVTVHTASGSYYARNSVEFDITDACADDGVVLARKTKADHASHSTTYVHDFCLPATRRYRLRYHDDWGSMSGANYAAAVTFAARGREVSGGRPLCSTPLGADDVCQSYNRVRDQTFEVGGVCGVTAAPTTPYPSGRPTASPTVAPSAPPTESVAPSLLPSFNPTSAGGCPGSRVTIQVRLLSRLAGPSRLAVARLPR